MKRYRNEPGLFDSVMLSGVLPLVLPVVAVYAFSHYIHGAAEDNRTSPTQIVQENPSMPERDDSPQSDDISNRFAFLPRDEELEEMLYQDNGGKSKGIPYRGHDRTRRPGRNIKSLPGIRC